LRSDFHPFDTTPHIADRHLWWLSMRDFATSRGHQLLAIACLADSGAV